MGELNKYFTSQTTEVLRSAVNPADYNPRTITPEARRLLKANIKKNGVIGGLVWNRRTGNLVSGHQRIAVLDELNKYDGTPQTDYKLKVEAIDADAKTEKELNIWFNNTSVQGEWDYDKLALLVPDIDYRGAGLTEADLQLIGIDFTMQTQDEKDTAQDFDNLLEPVREQKAERRQAVLEAKQRIKEEAQEGAENLDAYVMLNFDTYKHKAAFMRRFGFDPMEKFIKGELFSDMVERTG